MTNLGFYIPADDEVETRQEGLWTGLSYRCRIALFAEAELMVATLTRCQLSSSWGFIPCGNSKPG